MIKWLKKTFIPHEGNDHHPHFWRNGGITFVLAAVMLAEIGVLAQSYLIINKDSYLAAVLPGVVAALTNDQRTENSASPLKENSLLDEAARLKAEDMASKGYFSHTTPEGFASWYWLDKVGYTYSHAGENLAVNFTDSKDVVDAWMKSPTHRANIVKQIYTEIGIGMAEGMYEGKPAIFVAQFFGTPKAAAMKVQNPTPATAASVRPAEKPKASTTTQVAKVVPMEQPTAPIDDSSFSTTSTIETRVAGVQVDRFTPSPNNLRKILSSPRHTGMYALFTLMFLVIAAYALYVFHKKGVHHPRVFATAVAFVIMIIGLHTLNATMFKDPLIIGQASEILVQTQPN